MAITDFADYKARLLSPNETVQFNTTSSVVIAGRLNDMWVQSAPAGVAPTTAAAPTRATAGALGQQNGASGVLATIGGRLNSAAPGTWLLCDRLSHQGGLVGNVITSQTTNLPTAALTRYTDGIGVMCVLSIYTVIGTTGSTITVTYTDTADASSTASAVVIGGTNFREVNRALLVPPAAGDLGFKSVQSVIINTTSTGTAGAFGVTLFKPLAALIGTDVGDFAIIDLITGGLGGGFNEIVDDACLFLLAIPSTGNALATGSLILSEY